MVQPISSGTQYFHDSQKRIKNFPLARKVVETVGQEKGRNNKISQIARNTLELVEKIDEEFKDSEYYRLGIAKLLKKAIEKIQASQKTLRKEPSLVLSMAHCASKAYAEFSDLLMFIVTFSSSILTGTLFCLHVFFGIGIAYWIMSSTMFSLMFLFLLLANFVISRVKDKSSSIIENQLIESVLYRTQALLIQVLDHIQQEGEVALRSAGTERSYPQEGWAQCKQALEEGKRLVNHRHSQTALESWGRLIDRALAPNAPFITQVA